MRLYTALYGTRGTVGDRNNSAARVQKINHYICYIKRLGRVSLPRGGIETVWEGGRTRKTLIFPTCVSRFCTRVYIYTRDTSAYARDLRNVIEFNCRWAGVNVSPSDSPLPFLHDHFAGCVKIHIYCIRTPV